MNVFMCVFVYMCLYVCLYAWISSNVLYNIGTIQFLLTNHESMDSQQGEAFNVLGCNKKSFHIYSQCEGQKS